MTTLIICIDRDNDIGIKADITSPVIGRSENLQAALKLGLADPEDSDTNCIFASVKLLDRLVAQGEEVEVVTLAGDLHIGLESDRKIMEQFNELNKTIHADKAILVSDGAEDEAILTILQSKIDVIGIERVIVKQERKIEGLYYFIQKAIEDEKMRKVVLPLALILMAWGVSLFFGWEGVMKGFIIFLIGAYLFMKTYHLEGDVNKIFTDVMEQINDGKLSPLVSLFSLIIFIIGFFRSIDELQNSQYYLDHGTAALDFTLFIYILMVMNFLVVWVILSLFVRGLGKITDVAVQSKGERQLPFWDKVWQFAYIPVFLIRNGLFLKAGLNITQFIAEPDSIAFSFQWTMMMIIVGIFLTIGGKYLYEQSGMKEEKSTRRYFPHLKRKKKTSGWRH